MDHIRLPKQINRLDIKVPILAKNAYDGAGFDTYPLRMGYTTSPGEQIGPATFRKTRTEDVLSFVQAWLYFGLLREVIGPGYQQSRIISRLDYCICTNQLNEMLSEALSPAVPVSFSGRLVARLLPRPVTERENSRLRGLLDFSWHQCNILDSVEPELESPHWAVLLLSIRLLVHQIRQRCGYPDANGVPLCAFPHSEVPSARPIREHMLQPASGWCQHQFQALVRKVSCSTLFYLANLRRFSEIRHDRCGEEDHCVAYNVDRNGYTRAHCSDYCNHECSDIYPPDLGKMHRFLEQGLIPVVECIRDNQTGQFTLDYVAAAPGTSYSAISHLWADGLGNQETNSVYLCQLKRLFEVISSGDRAVADYGPRPYQTKKRQSLLAALLGRLFRPLFRFELGRALPHRRSKVYFWLDVYCVPADGSYDPVKDLKNTALNRMTITYSWANYVLILDNELRHISLSTDYLEFAARVSVSGWNTRSWTYQEYSMGRLLVFATNGGIKFSDDIGLDYMIGHPSVGFQDARGHEEVISECSDLANLLFRPHLATGARNRGNDEYSAKVRSDNFARLWNVLGDKTTTKPLDAILIFAMLLDLNPAEVAALRPEERMKAIARTFSSLPLDFIFESAPVTETRAALGWIPSTPQRIREIGRLGYCQVDSGHRLLRLTTSTPGSGSEAFPTVLRISSLRRLSCRFVIDGESPQELYRMQVQGDYEMSPQGSEAVLLVAASNLHLLGTIHAGQCSKGICLIVTDRRASEQMEVSSVHPILVERCTSKVHNQSEQDTVPAEKGFRASSTKIVINYDVSDWHILRFRRDRKHAQRTSHMRAIGNIVILIWITWASIVGFLVPVMTVLFLVDDLSTALAPTVLGIGVGLSLVFGIYLLEFSRTFYPRSIDYITMAELCSDFKNEDSWWRGMSEVVPKRGTRVVPSRWYFSNVAITTLRCAVCIARILHKISPTGTSQQRDHNDVQPVSLQEFQQLSETY